MGYRHDIEVEYTDGRIKTYVKHCYYFKKTKMYRQLLQMLDKNEIITFKY